MITVPPAVTRCLGLTFLDVSSNSIETLPDELCGLRGLRELHLAWNKLAELPRDINQLTQLRTLCLGFNQIARLPPNLCKLRNLEILHVNDKRLGAVAAGDRAVHWVARAAAAVQQDRASAAAGEHVRPRLEGPRTD